MASWRFVDTDVERARWRGTLNYRPHPRVQFGLEFNPVVEEVGPLLTAFLLPESDRRPGFFVGTSSDRIGSPEGEPSYYLTAVKSMHRWPVSGYATLNWSGWDERFNFPFGMTVGREISVTAMYDGERTHALVSWAGELAAVSLMLIWLEDPGISVSTGF